MSLKNSIIVLWVYIKPYIPYCNIILCVTIYILGIYVFLSGYLLKRVVVNQNSSTIFNIGGNITCNDLSSLKTIAYDFNSRNSNRRTLQRSPVQKFDKAVIIVIDALRHDFVFQNASDDSKGGHFYANKISVFQQMVQHHPDHALLLPLHADPPTTTMQRLKGMTSGTLPTFIDMSSNFASSQISEDNIIRQRKSWGKNVVFMGDDTWESLFPGHFHRSFPFPSFNVKDLDTVDNGVLEHIYKEMEKEDAAVVIAHFLGVDHCGHRYGPRHPEMSRKLLQMNDMIRKVVKQLQNDTILFVLGDHGMTEDGDHGGDSFQEVSTALFVYSPAKLSLNFDMESISSAAQIDIVPTISLLLGLPIPFSNLGAAIPKMFAFSSKNRCFGKLDPLVSAALALAENSNQVNQYLQSYSSVSSDFSLELLSTANERLKRISLLWGNVTDDLIETKKTLQTLCLEYREYLLHIKRECEKVWATFCLKKIGVGFSILCVAVVLNLLLTECIVFRTVFKITATNFIFCCLFMLLYSSPLFMSIPITISVFIFIKLYLFSPDIIASLPKAFNFPSVIVVIFFLASFSNSFIIHEDISVMYLLQSVLLYRFSPSIMLSIKSLTYKGASATSKDKQSKVHSKNVFQRLLLPMLFLCLMIIIRMQPLFRKCREDQIFCENSMFLTALENLQKTSTSSYQVMRLMLSWMSAVIPVVAFVVLVTVQTPQASYTVAMICIKYGLSFTCVCTCLRWWLNIVPAEVLERILNGNKVILSKAALFTSLIIYLLLLGFPILPERPWETASKAVYSGSLGLLVFAVLQPLYLTAGDGMALAIFLMSVCMVLHLVLVEISVDVSAEQKESHEWIDLLTWSLLSRHWFYGTGHQPTFPAIQWDAAFLISHSDVPNHVLSAIFVLMNTFSAHILHGLALPYLLVWSKSSMYSSRGVLRFQMNYLLFYGIKLLGTVAACILLRRHLMTWSIFTPKLIYEVCGMFITMLSLAVSYIFMYRVTYCYHKLIKSNFRHIIS